MLSDIRNEECPKCHEKGALFVCSMGAVNCSNCCEYIRPLTADEWDERQEAIKAIMVIKQFAENKAQRVGSRGAGPGSSAGPAPFLIIEEDQGAKPSRAHDAPDSQAKRRK